FPPYFMKDGVVFLYQQYEIACYAAGMPACVIPYSALLPFMTPAARELVPGSGR
ncbi:MAG: RsiV family protein, partial [Muribaculaceae bacterium]|nr:RsiV family protein [Muribaculaceae bacterium]